VLPDPKRNEAVRPSWGENKSQNRPPLLFHNSGNIWRHSEKFGIIQERFGITQETSGIIQRTSGVI
jgi:hypothetical protein